jgi:type I restriction enzyme, S subunit
MSALPHGWAEATLGEVCEVVSGATPRTTVPEYWGGEVAWITPEDLSGYEEKTIAGGARRLTSAGYESCSARLMPPGAVLFTSRAPIGYVAIASQPLCTNQGFKSFVPREGLLSDYLYWFLRHATDEMRSRASGTTFPELSKTKAAETRIPIAPVAEQHRIVSAIEEQFSRLDAAEGLLADTHRRLSQLRSAVLSSVLKGQWPLARIGDVASVGGGATPRRSDVSYWASGTIPWVTSGQLTNPFVREPAALITEKALRETSVKLWPKHTLLVALYGEGKTRGSCSELQIEATTNQACAAILLKDDSVDRAYLKLFFAASYDANRRLASGGVQPNLSLGLIKSLAFPLPPLEEQQRIVAETERHLSLADSLAEALKTASRRSLALRRSVLGEAFSGKLVSQDLADEPASAVLERIAAARRTESKLLRRRPKVSA